MNHRVVVVAMKPQLRGRIRRNVTTLLELGAEVVVVNSRPRDDFFLGLQHPNLRAHFVDVKSLSVRYTERATRQKQAREQRWREQAAWRAAKQVSPAVAAVPSAGALPQFLHRARTSRRVARAERRLLRAWRKSSRWAIRQGRAARQWRIRTIKSALRPLHRVSRFAEFWLASSRQVAALGPVLVVSSDLPGLVGANIAARRLRRPHLHDCHELYLESTAFKPFERVLLAPVEARYMRRADGVVVVNRTIRDEYRKRYGVDGVVVRSCAPLPDGAMPPAADLHGQLGLPDSAKLVLYQGGFVEGRGLEVCIAAAQHFPTDAYLVLLGYGALAEQLQRQAAELDLTDRVRFVPAVPPAQLVAYTAAAAVGLIPYQPVSRNNTLALPNKVFEYGAAGVPFVASDLPELRLVTEEWGCGVVCDPFDPKALAAAVTRVLDPARYGEYQQSATRFGAVNTWANEKRILTSQILRLVPELAKSPEPADGHRRPSSAPLRVAGLHPADQHAVH